MTSPNSPFPALMSQVLSTMGLALPAAAQQDIYTLRFDDGLALHCGCFQPGWCDVLAETGRLPPQRSTDLVLRLLALNRFEPAGQPVSVGADAASGQVFLWTRQALATLSVDGMQQLFKQVQARAQSVRRCLDGKSETTASATPRLVSAGRDAGMRSVLRRQFGVESR